MACPQRWWTDGACRLDTSWAGGAVGEVPSGSAGVSALGKEVTLTVHIMRFPVRAGLHAWVQQRVHPSCAANHLSTIGDWRLLLKTGLMLIASLFSERRRCSRCASRWGALAQGFMLIGFHRIHAGAHHSSARHQRVQGHMACTLDGIGGNHVRSGVRSTTAGTTPCPISMPLTRIGRPQACAALAQSTPGVVAHPCRTAQPPRRGEWHMPPDGVVDLSPQSARAAQAWTARRSTRRSRKPSHKSTLTNPYVEFATPSSGV
jgi:hypothetical protein